jgi:hypothetical protein
MSNNPFSSNQSFKDKLKQKFENEDSGSGGGNRGPDLRFLNHYDLPENGKMHVLLLPDSEGEYVSEYTNHGGGMPRDLRAGTINCSYHSNGESCPACAISWEAHQNNDIKTRNMWGKSTHIIAQCIVLSSDVEINQPEDDDNLVRLFRMPVAIYKRMKNDILEGLIEEPNMHELVIKKTKNGQNNNYDQSYFIQKEVTVPDEIIEAYEQGLVRPYDFNDLVGDVIPKPTTAEEVQEWVDNVKDKIRKKENGESPNANQSGNTNAGNSSGGSDSGASPTPQEASQSDAGGDDGDTSGGDGESLQERLKRMRRQG